MATAIFAIIMLGGFLGVGWLIRYESRQIADRVGVVLHNLACVAADASETADGVIKISDVLTEASRIKAAKSPTFDGDKIQEKSASLRYVPIARRRAQAEAASQTPATHSAQVRANNTRALETAG